MKKFAALLLTLCFLLSAQTVYASPNPPSVQAEGAILMDLKSGQVLFEENADKHLAMASTTKIMTALLALEKGNLDDEVVISPTVEDRKKVYGTLVYLEAGEKFTLRNLLYSTLLLSANDAATAVAEHIGGNVDNFVEMMNQKAKELGANDTHFANPHGLTQAGHYSSARDMAIIARYAMKNPVFAEIVKTKEKEIPREKEGLPTKLNNINHLLWLYSEADGIKTGYTDQAGPCIVASATRGDRQLVAVILRAATPRIMYKDAEDLLEYGFANFNQKLLAAKGEVINSITVGNEQVLKLAASEDVFATYPLTGEPDFQLKVNPTDLKLPVAAGEIRGELRVSRGNKQIETVPLVAANGITPKKVNPHSNRLYLLSGIPVFAIVLLMLMAKFRRRRATYRAGRYRRYRYYID